MTRGMDAQLAPEAARGNSHLLGDVVLGDERGRVLG